jgi:hypothetical protein
MTWLKSSPCWRCVRLNSWEKNSMFLLHEQRNSEYDNGCVIAGHLYVQMLTWFQFMVKVMHLRWKCFHQNYMTWQRQCIVSKATSRHNGTHSNRYSFRMLKPKCEIDSNNHTDRLYDTLRVFRVGACVSCMRRTTELGNCRRDRLVHFIILYRQSV